MKILCMQCVSSLAKSWNIIPKKLYSKVPALFDCAPDLVERGICNVETCDPEKCHPQPRVVIIGAGMAGISAAARLAQRGITNLVVLEASDRPGGRIHSSWLGDVVVELGAQWKPTKDFIHPVYILNATEDPPRPGVPAVRDSRGLFNRVVTSKMSFPGTIAAYRKFRQIEEEAAQIYCLGSNKSHGFIINFMSLRIQQELHEFPQEMQHDAARIMFGLINMLSARCSNDTAFLCCDNKSCFMNIPGGEVRVPLGMIDVIAPLLREIPNDTVRYCKPVNCVYWGTAQKCGHRAIVCTSDGEEFPADYVIVTVSLGVLMSNSVKMFCPALPASKMDAMRCLGFGSCNKIYMEYCRPFWFWHQGNLSFNYNCNQLCERHDWTRGVTLIEPVPHSKHVICAWVIGPEAIMVEGLCDRDVAEGLTCLLRESTQNCNIPYPTTVLRSYWSSNPFFQGSYSFDNNPADGSAQNALACPLPGPTESIPPILLFCGEATVPGHFATVAGARLSGIREAERIVQLTIQFKGPPLPLSEESRTAALKEELPKEAQAETN